MNMRAVADIVEPRKYRESTVVRSQRRPTTQVLSVAGDGMILGGALKLYMLRHGLAGNRSEWKDDDTKRPLTEEGKEKIEDAAASIAKWDLHLDVIITSPYTRAYQTAEIVARKLKLLDRLVKDDRLGYGFDVDKLAKILSGYPKANVLMFVGHEPDFSETIARLIGGGHVVMKKGGLACIDLPDPQAMAGELLWLVPPKLMG